MDAQNETVLLDTSKYNENTHKWDVPILRFRGVSCVSLHVDGEQVAPGGLSVSKNVINMPRDVHVGRDTVAHLVVAIKPPNVLVTFWLPIILAAIGLLGTTAQPILHEVGVLYAQEPRYELSPKSWEYDPEAHRFHLKLALEPLREGRLVKESELGDWRLVPCVRHADTSVGLADQEYCFVGGPFGLQTLMEVSVDTDEAFSAELIESAGTAQCCFVLAHKGLAVPEEFQPSQYGAELVRVVGGVGVSASELEQ